jgi:hypothetical protein
MRNRKKKRLLFLITELTLWRISECSELIMVKNWKLAMEEVFLDQAD